MAERLGAAERALAQLTGADTAFAQLVIAKTRLAQADYDFMALQVPVAAACFGTTA